MCCTHITAALPILRSAIFLCVRMREAVPEQQQYNEKKIFLNFFPFHQICYHDTLQRLSFFGFLSVTTSNVASRQEFGGRHTFSTPPLYQNATLKKNIHNRINAMCRILCSVLLQFNFNLRSVMHTHTQNAWKRVMRNNMTFRLADAVIIRRNYISQKHNRIFALFRSEVRLNALFYVLHTHFWCFFRR